MFQVSMFQPNGISLKNSIFQCFNNCTSFSMFQFFNALRLFNFSIFSMFQSLHGVQLFNIFNFSMVSKLQISMFQYFQYIPISIFNVSIFSRNWVSSKSAQLNSRGRRFQEGKSNSGEGVLPNLWERVPRIRGDGYLSI